MKKEKAGAPAIAVLDEQREANERLVLATLRAHELRDQAVTEHAAMAEAARSAEAARALAEAAMDALESRARDGERLVERQALRHLADMEELQNANRLATLGKLAASVAHELGSPLAVIKVRAQMIAGGEVPPEELAEEAAVILQQTLRMTQMVSEVLELARPKAPIRIAVDLAALGRQAVSLLAPLTRNSDVKLQFSEDGAPAWVLGDASRLLQILTNLIFNATQSMAKAGVVRLDLGRRRACPPGGADAEYLAFDVTDQGTGISPEILRHIFDAFFTTKRNQDGTGLGLSVSQRIASEHGGFIGVASEVGRGSRFTLYLPPLAGAP
jgi:signal transduction histidine kinase